MLVNEGTELTEAHTCSIKTRVRNPKQDPPDQYWLHEGQLVRLKAKVLTDKGSPKSPYLDALKQSV